MITKAPPVQLRICLELAQLLAKQGIRFVPMPVVDETEYQARIAEFDAKLEQIASELEKEERVS
jgi:hypothetical protein